jgi:hypothetical protein
MLSLRYENQPVFLLFSKIDIIAFYFENRSKNTKDVWENAGFVNLVFSINVVHTWYALNALNI